MVHLIAVLNVHIHALCPITPLVQGTGSARPCCLSWLIPSLAGQAEEGIHLAGGTPLWALSAHICSITPFIVCSNTCCAGSLLLAEPIPSLTQLTEGLIEPGGGTVVWASLAHCCPVAPLVLGLLAVCAGPIRVEPIPVLTDGTHVHSVHSLHTVVCGDVSAGHGATAPLDAHTLLTDDVLSGVAIARLTEGAAVRALVALYAVPAGGVEAVVVDGPAGVSATLDEALRVVHPTKLADQGGARFTCFLSAGCEKGKQHAVRICVHSSVSETNTFVLTAGKNLD